MPGGLRVQQGQAEHKASQGQLVNPGRLALPARWDLQGRPDPKVPVDPMVVSVLKGQPAPQVQPVALV